MPNYEQMNQGLNFMRGTLARASDRQAQFQQQSLLQAQKQQYEQQQEQVMLQAASEASDLFRGLDLPGGDLFADELQKNPRGAMAVGAAMGGIQNYFTMLGDRKNEIRKQTAIQAVFGPSGAVDERTGMTAMPALVEDINTLAAAGAIEPKDAIDLLDPNNTQTAMEMADGSIVSVDLRTGTTKELRGPDPNKVGEMRRNRVNQNITAMNGFASLYRTGTESYQKRVSAWRSLKGTIDATGIDDTLSMFGSMQTWQKLIDDTGTVRGEDVEQISKARGLLSEWMTAYYQAEDGKVKPDLTLKVVKAIRLALVPFAKEEINARENMATIIRDAGQSPQEIFAISRISDPTELLKQLNTAFPGEDLVADDPVVEELP